jgi:hypothetical protein
LVRLTQQQQLTTQHKKDNKKMAKKNIKVRDLKPKKDAKGGGGYATGGPKYATGGPVSASGGPTQASGGPNQAAGGPVHSD